MSDLKTRVDEAAEVIRSRTGSAPRVGIILGTGLGNLARKIEDATTIDYESIPHFPRSTVTSHAGQFISGMLSGQPVVVMEGRFHFYEGYSLEQVTFPVRVMKALGADTLIVTNACGGLNPQYTRGDIMLMEDHINLMGLAGLNPLVGANDDELGPRFPDMCRPYDRALMEKAKAVATREGIHVQQGVYVGVAGPCLETRAEYRFLRLIGADVVGMSTTAEVTVAMHAGLRVLGLSVITDVCLPDALEPVQIEEIIEAANSAGPHLERIIVDVLAGETL